MKTKALPGMGVAKRGRGRNGRAIVALDAESVKQRKLLFVTEFIRGNNATEAYRKAGYKDGPGAAQAAHALLNRPDVQHMLRERRAQLAKTYGLELDEWMAKLKAIAGSKVSDLFAHDGTLLPPHLWPEGIAEAVESFDVTETGSVKTSAGMAPTCTKRVKLHNKLQAILKLVDMATGGHGKPSTQVNVNVTFDRAAADEARMKQLFGRFMPNYDEVRAKQLALRSPPVIDVAEG